MFELESLPSGNIFQTKSETKTESKSGSRSPEKIKQNNGIQDINSSKNFFYNDPQFLNLASKQQSENESSELKETADFFRPSQDSD